MSQEGLRLGSVSCGDIILGGRISGRGSVVWLALAVLLCAGFVNAQDTPDAASPPANQPTIQQASDPQQGGVIRGTVVDKTGTLLSGVRVRLTHEGQTTASEVTSGDDGQFTFVNAAEGSFQLTLIAANYATQTYSGTLHTGEVLAVPQITLQLATEVTTVRVEENTVEIAQEQMKDQEKQRVLGVIPNFYVSYVPNAAPLNARQKYELAWKATVDPATFLVTGVIAGAQQATNAYKGYGQGAQGYAKRYGATYGDIIIGTFIGSAILPSIMKQDPRYFYKGTGSTKSRFWYAISNAVICKGDNGKWQVCYSSLLGSLAAGGISNAYYPESDRGVGLTFQNFGIGIAATAGVNLLQEFVLPKLTSHKPAKALDPPTP